LTGALRGKAAPVRTTLVLYWLVIVGGILSAILAAALSA
jgi:hypothetical protein